MDGGIGDLSVFLCFAAYGRGFFSPSVEMVSNDWLIKEDCSLAWTSVFENEQLTVVVDEDKHNIMVELSTGGYRPRFVTAHWSAEETKAVIQALEQAVALLKQKESN